MRRRPGLRHAIAHLLEEHRAAERVLQILSAALEQRDLSRVGASLAFLKYVVDRVHHAKEEDVLFTKLIEAATDIDPATIQTLHTQHTHGRSYIRAAEALIEDVRLGSDEATHALVETIRAYGRYAETHMKQEERVVFPLAVELLGHEDDEILLEHFQRVQGLLIPSEQYDAYMAFSRETDAVVASSAPSFDLPPPTEAKTTILGSLAPAPRGRLLFEDRRHRVHRLDANDGERGVETNIYVVENSGRAIVLDPGGPETYQHAFTELQERTDGARLEYIFLSSQSPEVVASLSNWLKETDAEAVTSDLWSGPSGTCGLDAVFESRIRGVADEGGILELGRTDLALLPAHFLHSAGTLQLFDPRSKILFSGDLGASLGATAVVVEDFDAHVPTMVDFHQRHMANRSLVRAWVRMIEQLDVHTIAPRRGALLEGEAVVAQFLEWCKTIECGTDLIESKFELPTRRL